MLTMIFIKSFRTMIKDIRCLRWTPRWRRWLATAGTTSSSMVSRFKRVRDKIIVVILIILFYLRLIILIHGLPVQESQRQEKNPFFSFHLYHHRCLSVQEGLTSPTTTIFFLRYESSTLILYKELSSPIFQSRQSVSEASVTPVQISTHFVQYIRAWMSSTDPISSITNCYRLIVSYTDPVHSFIIS